MTGDAPRQGTDPDINYRSSLLSDSKHAPENTQSVRELLHTKSAASKDALTLPCALLAVQYKGTPTGARLRSLGRWLDDRCAMSSHSSAAPRQGARAHPRRKPLVFATTKA